METKQYKFKDKQIHNHCHDSDFSVLSVIGQNKPSECVDCLAHLLI